MRPILPTILSLHFVYGDRRGHIGYFYNVRIPRRAPGWDWSLDPPCRSPAGMLCGGLVLSAYPTRSAVIAGWWNWLRANLAARLLPRSLLTVLARDVMEAQTPPELR